MSTVNIKPSVEGNVHIDCLFIGNDNIVTLAHLRDSDGSLLEAATVEATLLHLDDLSEVAGITWPATLAHVSSGTYVGAVDSDAVLTNRRRYLLRITAVESTFNAQWDIEMPAVYRK